MFAHSQNQDLSLYCSVPDPDGNARQATVLEQLEDLVRQAHLATSKQLLIWLRLLSQLQVQNPQQQQQWQQDLKTVVELRAQLQVITQCWVTHGTAPTSCTHLAFCI